jgi:hypothetical protein
MEVNDKDIPMHIISSDIPECGAISPECKKISKWGAISPNANGERYPGTHK